MSSSPAINEWRMHWLLVFASMIGFSFHAVMHYSMGLFMEPLRNEFGWSSAQLSVGFLISAMLTVPLAPFVGALIDKWGVRRLAIPGLALKSISIAIFATTSGSVVQWYALWVIYALVALGVKSTVWTAAVSGVFNSSRGLALAVTLSGTALTQIIAPPLSQWLIDDYGWRSAFIILSIIWGLPALVICYFFLHDAHYHHQCATSVDSSVKAAVLFGLTVREAIVNIALIRVAIATLITMTIGVGVIVHLVPILNDINISREEAAYLASLSGVAGIVGKLLTGYLLDRFNAGWVGGLTLAAMAASFFFLLGPYQSSFLVLLAIIIIGYTAGCKLQISAYLTSQYGGMKNFGKIFGVMASMIALGSGLGPVAVGFIYDVAGSYSPLMYIGIFASLVSGLMLIGLGPYPKWGGTDVGEAGGAEQPKGF